MHAYILLQDNVAVNLLHVEALYWKEGLRLFVALLLLA